MNTNAIAPIELKPAGVKGWNFPEAESLYASEVAAASSSDPTPRPDLNGVSIIAIGAKTVWLIDRGFRRGFTSARTFESVMDGWGHIHEVLDITAIPEGPLIPNDFALIQANNAKTVYLLDGGRKRGIPSETVFTQFSFSWNKIVRVDARIVAAIPDNGILTGR